MKIIKIGICIIVVLVLALVITFQYFFRSAVPDYSGTETLAGLTEQKAPLIILDLGEMDFICSSGLGAIIVGYLKSRHHKGKFHLANAQPAVRELLETTRLTKLFAIYSSVAAALAS